MKIKIVSFFEFVVATCIILNCESIWCWMNHSGIIKMAIFVCITVSLIILLGYRKDKFTRKELTMFGFLLLYLCIFLLLNISTNLVDTIQLIVMVALLTLYCRDGTSCKSLLNKIANIMIGLAIMSLFFFIIGSILHIINPNQSLMIYVNNEPKNCNSYLYLHYEVQKEDVFNLGFYRNTGIFYEAPKYTLILSFILLYEMFISKSSNIKRKMILSITIVTTMSLTGIYALVLSWILYLLFKYPSNSKKGFFMRAMVVLIILITGSKIISVFGQSLEAKGSTASYSTRMDNYEAGFKAWMEKPILGAGYLNMDTIIANYSVFRLNDIGYSNSIFRVLAQGGIYLLMMYLIPILKGIVGSIKNRNMYMLSFIIMFIYFFITTSFSYNYITVLLLLYFYFESKKEEFKS